MKFLYTTSENTRAELISKGFTELKPISLCNKKTYCFSNDSNIKEESKTEYFSTKGDLIFSNTLFL